MRRPEDEHRGHDAPSGLAVELVVLDVDGRTGAVVLAHRLDAVRIAEQTPIRGEDLRWIAIRVLAETELPAHMEREEGVGVAGDQTLGQRCREREECPVPVAARDVGGHSGPDVPGGDDVEDREPLHALRMIERHPVGDAAAPVVAGHGEGVEPQPCHRLHLIECHRPLAVRRMVCGGQRPEGVAVPGQVGHDDRVVLGEPRGGRVPHEQRFGVAVEQEQRRAAATDQRVHRSS